MNNYNQQAKSVIIYKSQEEAFYTKSYSNPSGVHQCYPFQKAKQIIIDIEEQTVEVETTEGITVTYVGLPFSFSV